MKLTNLIWIIVLIMSSCSKDSFEPIQLYYDIYNDKPNPIENNQISLLFPTFDKIKLVIMGGDGNYTVSNLDEAIVNVRMENKFIDITPLSIGSSIITVVDNSGNSYALNVKVHYILPPPAQTGWNRYPQCGKSNLLHADGQRDNYTTQCAHHRCATPP